MEQSEFGST